MSRSLKRLIIILVYLFVGAIFGTLIYFIFGPKPSCSDGKLNQGEEKVDCGGPACGACEKEINAKDLEISEKYFVYGNNNQFDVMAEITNPNDKYGVAKFKYNFQLVDQAGAVLAKREGINFILPGEKKYVIELNLTTAITPYTLKFDISEINWEEFLGYEEPKLNIYRKEYNEANDKNTLFGLLKNESYFDFNSIEINMVLRGADGKPIALGKNEMRTIGSQEERDFKMIWPYKFGGDVQDIEIRAEADVFNTDNFIKKYLPSARYQDYGIEK